jgi:SOS-response transcriptional repressor LexA
MVAKRKPAGGRKPRPEHWDKGLSDRQGAVFRFIRLFARKQDMAPSRAEIRAAFPEYSASSLGQILKALELADYIRRIEID